jgi:hypothetical protein
MTFQQTQRGKLKIFLAVRAYSLDTTSGQRTLLSGSPMTFTCSSSAPDPGPTPTDPPATDPSTTDPDPSTQDPPPAADTATDDSVSVLGGGCNAAGSMDLSAVGSALWLLLALLALRLTSSRRTR